MTTPITVNIPHQLGRAEARKRLEEGFVRLEQQIAGGHVAQIQKTWTEDRLNFSAKVMGQGLSGRMDVLDDAIRLEVDLPGFLGMLAGKIKGRLQKEGQLLLEKK